MGMEGEGGGGEGDVRECEPMEGWRMKEGNIIRSDEDGRGEVFYMDDGTIR